MKQRTDPLVGLKISDKLTLVEKIGRGGMGTVYKARHEILERDFAVKILRSDMRKDPVVVERFKREARAASRLEHPNVVYISDFDQLSDGRFYIVMEYIPGQSLRDVIQEEGPLAIDRACKILMQVADALDYAHERGVIHRDLKSENIFITNRRDMERVKILDFGLAKLVSDALDLQSITSEGQIFGTPETMAPEQIASIKVDHRVDLYALGVLTYEILLAKPPFSGPMLQVLMAHKKQPVPRPSSERSDIPTALDDLVIRSMEKEPADRYSRAAEMQMVYQQVINDLSRRSSDRSVFSMERGRSKSFVQIPAQESAPQEKEWLRRQFNEFVLEVAEHLRDRDFGSTKLTQQLATILELEEQVTSLRSERAIYVNKYDSLEHSGRLRSSKLRHAIISLNLELKSLHASGNEDQITTDVKFQLMELEKRLAKVVSMQETDEKELETRIARLNSKAEELEYEIARGNESILQMVEEARETVGNSSTLKTAYSQLDEMKKRLKKLEFSHK
ncbi:protein kinase [Myxococcota bacterium]|nr:protein kinase [Myxococcota bacterium]MBU1535039.1 protein kinase [Myxococcota bacterium]